MTNARRNSMSQLKASDFSPEHRQMIELMKDQLLIVLINRLGGKVSIPVAEIDATGQFNLSLMLDQATKVFHFEVGKKSDQSV